MADAETDDPQIVPGPGYRIVGIAGDTKYRDLKREIRPAIYTPLVSGHAYFALRTTGDPAALVNTARNIVANADSRLPLFDVRTQAEHIARTHFQQRLLSRLSSFFAVLATALACIGLYGLLSYEVAMRTRELGIRMALGAQKRHLMKLVVRHGVVLSLAGVLLGLAGAFAVTRFMASMLYNVRPTDPGTFVAVSCLLFLIALAACAIPALRAMRVDPLVALAANRPGLAATAPAASALQRRVVQLADPPMGTRPRREGKAHSSSGPHPMPRRAPHPDEPPASSFHRR